MPRAALKALKEEGVDIPLGLHERLDLLDQHGFIYIPSKRGGVPRFKRHTDGSGGLPLQDIISDIPPINSQAKERMGYATQKPSPCLSASLRPARTRVTLFLTRSAGALPPWKRRTGLIASGSGSILRFTRSSA